VVIHRAISGSLERFLGIAIEHFAGAFPLWLAPVQAVVLPVSEKHAAYAREVCDELRKAGIRVELKDNESLGKRIREIKKEKIPCHIVVGDAEAEAKTVTVEN